MQLDTRDVYFLVPPKPFDTIAPQNVAVVSKPDGGVPQPVRTGAARHARRVLPRAPEAIRHDPLTLVLTLALIAGAGAVIYFVAVPKIKARFVTDEVRVAEIQLVSPFDTIQ